VSFPEDGIAAPGGFRCSAEISRRASPRFNVAIQNAAIQGRPGTIGPLSGQLAFRLAGRFLLYLSKQLLHVASERETQLVGRKWQNPSKCKKKESKILQNEATKPNIISKSMRKMGQNEAKRSQLGSA
jgi:hypothetical protein